VIERLFPRAILRSQHGPLAGWLDSRIRPDDVAKVLEPILEVNEDLRDYLSENKLKQKYWVSYFTDLVIDRTWGDITKGEGANAQENG
jgi:hypothetical protein